VLTLGEKLKDLRTEHNARELRTTGRRLSLKELGENIGIAPATLSDYENNKKMPGLENAAQMAQFYGVSLEYLAGLSEPINMDTGTIQRKTGLSKNAVEALYIAPAELCSFISAIMESSHTKGLVHDLIKHGGNTDAT